MSNILIIKHGSLGDIAQACGAIQDIFENHKNSKIYLLTTKPYFELFKKNPFINEVLLDKRLSRFNLIYLFSLMSKLKKINFIKVYDLQNSSRTKFYKKILFPNSNLDKWSSSETTLPKGINKDEFDKKSVLERFEHQLKISGVITKNTMIPDFNWSCSEITHIKKKYKFKDEFKILTAPGPTEINDAKNINAISILNNERALNISELSSLINDSKFIVANDTGPAHMAAHLKAKGLTLFGSHTSAYKVSIERENFKPIQVESLDKLSPEKVFERLQNNI